MTQVNPWKRRPELARDWPKPPPAKPQPDPAFPPGPFADAVALACTWSPYLSSLVRAQPALLARLYTRGPDATLNELLARVQKVAPKVTAIAEMMQLLRHSKAELALIVALADLAQVWTLAQVTQALTRFADLAVESALAFALKCGKPAREPLTSGCAVFALGKMGGHELNYSSDIDLIVLFDTQRAALPEDVEATGYFVRATQLMTRILQDLTEDGYVFRVDLRLRPDPNATPVALSMTAAELYYQSTALNWERAAFIKARVCAGDQVAGDAFLKGMSGFMWRRHLDYHAMRDIHAIKAQIHEHHGHDAPQLAGYNVKLSRGGIREIEFFAQIHQLIAGGRNPSLRSNQTLETLDQLVRAKLIKAADAKALHAAYRFYRNLEHRLQMLRDEQTHMVPDDAKALKALAGFCGFPSVKALETRLLGHASKVTALYDQLLGPEVPQTGLGTDADAATGQDHLKSLKFSDPERATELIEGWRRGRRRATRAPQARESLDRLLPGLLAAFAKSDDAMASLARFDDLLERLPAGVAFFALLEASPPLCALLARLLAVSPALADTLARQPSLLDATLDPEFFQPLPSTETLTAGLRKRCADLPYETMLDEVRRWAAEKRFQVGVQLLEAKAGQLEAGASLARVADAVLAQLVPAVADNFAQTHGTVADSELAVLALGRYGAENLTATSDLDLVFLFSGPHDAQSDGAKPLGATAYFSRLAQRLITALSAPTAAGELYEIDTRLRAHGAQGLLAITLESYLRYQKSEAWVWEHLALTRARVVFASAPLKKAIERGLRKILSTKRDPKKLVDDVLEMRAELDGRDRDARAWDFKAGPGGLLDLEFIVEATQLRHGGAYPRVLKSNLGKALEAIGTIGVFTSQDVAKLTSAWLDLMAAQALVRLCYADPPDARGPSPAFRECLARALGRPNFKAADARLKAARRTVVSMWLEAFGVARSGSD
jgi:[glutamine synthetase] adenylyltransferase / [glutamine synthetase]-adenylyl-L-tyrosine phosphorylase